ncbi:hypothetical protein EDM57_02145 [Brevibacillus gelatini]|uniref:Uncharacterized protein n=1 Tax=Brevibacillus gelatini TaxID=1655277 RepID=A0A3M8BE67_9BACL|nr:hypothetical protein [Brevibacillus gelatini]RNB61185.1 hypothetical protein EDM57_02145 [Brevibacillus gelatini]
MGKLIGYILLVIVAGGMLVMVAPEIALFLGLCVIVGTLFYIVDLLKREQPRIIQARLERSFRKRESGQGKLE